MTYDPQLLVEHNDGHFYALWPDPESGLPVLVALPIRTEADDHPPHPTQHPDPMREGWYDPIDLEPAVRESLVRQLTSPAPGSLPTVAGGEHRRVLDAIGEDTFTTTVEGAAGFERDRAMAAGEHLDALPDPSDWRDEPVSRTEAEWDGWDGDDRVSTYDAEIAREDHDDE